MQQEAEARSGHQLWLAHDDAGKVLKFLGLNMDQFRFLHFETNFLALPDTYPAV